MRNGLLLHTELIHVVFKAFFNPIAKNWTLESLTLGPLFHRADYELFNETFQNFPALPRLSELTIIYRYQRDHFFFDVRCWSYFNDLFRRTDLFPQSMQIDLQVTINSVELDLEQRIWLGTKLLGLREYRRVTLWGCRKWDLSCPVSLFLPGYHPRRVVLNASVEVLKATGISLRTTLHP